jgi:hypothetical protein
VADGHRERIKGENSVCGFARFKQIATPSGSLFFTCRGKIKSQKLHKICTYIKE